MGSSPDFASMQKHIKPLNMNGLEGRMLKIPGASKNKRQIMMVYGHHASLERMYGIAEAFADEGTVTMPDMPGFGGMDSFDKINITPSIDALADYLAAFIQLRYKKQKITIVAMSLGFAIITRMLQRYPHLTSQVDLLVSLVGFTHKYDLTFSKKRLLFYKTFTRLFSYKIPAAFFYNTALHPSLIRLVYSKTHNAKSKFSNISKNEKSAATEYEVKLWRMNDVRTYMITGNAMLNLDNCNQHIDLMVHHISVAGDQYFDAAVVEQHMRVIFNDFIEHSASIDKHTPTILASKEEAAPFVPESFRKVMQSGAAK